jgi:hypothetical protein
MIEIRKTYRPAKAEKPRPDHCNGYLIKAFSLNVVFDLVCCNYQ